MPLSLAELRRRAAQRVRAAEAALVRARARWERAAQECARLRAPGPGAGLGGQAREHTESGAEGVRALEAGLAAARRAGEEWRAEAERWRSRCRVLEAELVEAREGAARVSARCRELEAEAAGEWRAQAAALEAELVRAQAGQARLEGEIARLLAFLDDLTGVLSSATDGGE